MSEGMQKTLVALKDVQGIRGSFVLDADGALLAIEMPSLFEPAMFAETGPRIGRLAESFSALGDELESCLVRFADHILCVRQFAKGESLCILSDANVNLPALRMAGNLAHRRLAGEVSNAKPMEAAAATPAPAPQPAPQQAAPVEIPEPMPAPERKTPRYYRGHLVDE